MRDPPGRRYRGGAGSEGRRLLGNAAHRIEPRQADHVVSLDEMPALLERLVRQLATEAEAPRAAE
jgi:hypothetical protein